jgi:para-nitrobenzyl esterase
MFRATRAWRDEDRKLSDTMLHSLIAFADTGVPQLNDLHWPAWNKRTEEYVVLGDVPRVEKLRGPRMDWLASHAPESSPQSAPATGPRD